MQLRVNPTACGSVLSLFPLKLTENREKEQFQTYKPTLPILCRRSFSVY